MVLTENELKIAIEQEQSLKHQNHLHPLDRKFIKNLNGRCIEKSVIAQACIDRQIQHYLSSHHLLFYTNTHSKAAQKFNNHINHDPSKFLGVSSWINLLQIQMKFFAVTKHFNYTILGGICC